MILHRRLRIRLCLCAAIIAFAFPAITSAQESSRSSGWIAIPAAEYQSLRARAYPPEPEPEAPPVMATATNESILLPPALAGITRASVQLPRQGVDIKLTGGFLSEKSASASESKWPAYGRGNEPLVFSWWRKADDHRSSQPLRLRGSLTELVGLGEDTTSIQAEVNAEAVQGAAHELKFQLPDKVTVNQVAGAMVADWEMKPGG